VEDERVVSLPVGVQDDANIEIEEAGPLVRGRATAAVDERSTSRLALGEDHGGLAPPDVALDQEQVAQRRLLAAWQDAQAELSPA